MSALRGAWGLRFTAVEGVDSLLCECPASWPAAPVHVRVEPNPTPHVEWSRDRACHPLLGGNQIEIRRDPLAVDLVLARPTAPECVIAPHLTSAASTIATWAGRAAIHGGAFLHGGGAWVLLGDKEDGKSTTLGWLATLGVPIVTDDLAVCEEGHVLAGPRCVDLRREPAEVMGVGRNLGVVGTRERWRVDLPACPARSTLQGWIFLEWGSELTVERVSPIERMARIARHRALAIPWEDPETLLELATRPAYVWRRPREWRTVGDSTARLLAEIVDE